MQSDNIIKLTVGAVLGVVLLFSLALPLMTDAASNEKTFTNDGYYTLDKVDDATERVIVWEKANPDVLTIDGIALSMSFAELNRSYTLIGSENMIIRYQKQVGLTGIQGYYTNAGYVSFHTNSAADIGDTITVTVSAGNVTLATNGASPLNRDLGAVGTDAYIINPTDTGDYLFVMKKANTPAYLLGDSEIKFLGVSVAQAGPDAIALYGTGSIDGGVQISTIYKPASITTVSYSEPVATDSSIAGFENLYKLDKYNFTITYDANTYDATYSYFIVPAEVTANKTVQVDDAEISLISLIPLLLMVSLVLGVVAFAVRARLA